MFTVELVSVHTGEIKKFTNVVSFRQKYGAEEFIVETADEPYVAAVIEEAEWSIYEIYS